MKFPKINVLLCYIINEYFFLKMIIVKKIIIINSNELVESMFTFMIVEFFLIRTYLIWKTKKKFRVLFFDVNACDEEINVKFPNINVLSFYNK